MLRDVKVFSGPTSAFGALLLEHCKRLGVSPTELGQRAGFSGNSRVIYAMRPREGGTRSALLREEELQRLAQTLQLSAADSAALVLAGLLEGCPPRIRSYLQRLERENALLRDGRRSRG